MTMVRDAKIAFEKLKPKSAREKISDLPFDLENFNLSMSEIQKSWITNHQRLKFNDELLYAVFEYSKSILGNIDEAKGVVWRRNGITRMIHSILSNELYLCVSPFNTLNGDGYVQMLCE